LKFPFLSPVQEMTSTSFRSYADTKISVAVAALHSTVGAAAARFEKKRDFVDYHLNKLVDPTFHAGTWGGARNSKFDDQEQATFEVRPLVLLFACLIAPLVQVALYAELHCEPARTLQQFATALNDGYGWTVSAHFVGRVFRRWGVSVKNVKHKHVHKYSLANIRYAARYLLFITGIVDWRRIKFADESSFQSKGPLLSFASAARVRLSCILYLPGLAQKRAWAEAGREVHMKMSRQDYSAWTLSFTCLTDLHHESGCFLSAARAGTNRAEHYLTFVLDCVASQVRTNTPCTCLASFRVLLA
jgi:hypothetical protein